MRRVLFLIPIVVFVLVGIGLAVGLTRDPSERASPLEGRPAPIFDLAALPARGPDTGLATSDLKGAVSVVNIFASWCAPCRIEHPILSRLAADGVTVHGIDYKDDPAKAETFLSTLGDPYARVGADTTGRAGIDWGITGVPETFIIDRNGDIVHRHVGPLTANDVETTIEPILRDLEP
ncbi:DsbE family thiol:disulfide interchange protein [Marinivivus vitaminiproducens]|uniref:DsbE family thiol:disulfide interchange protein n=1 Tax=Marinivivus vitaminiproducens TaxID=3035935 RepID=UPI002799BAC6|nr:DsbE family thiol:disulfide interchange protein [Geminicoccaceae bacterium SCSIO 64248]